MLTLRGPVAEEMAPILADYRVLAAVAVTVGAVVLTVGLGTLAMPS